MSSIFMKIHVNLMDINENIQSFIVKQNDLLFHCVIAKSLYCGFYTASYNVYRIKKHVFE